VFLLCELRRVLGLLMAEALAQGRQQGQRSGSLQHTAAGDHGNSSYGWRARAKVLHKLCIDDGAIASVHVALTNIRAILAFNTHLGAKGFASTSLSTQGLHDEEASPATGRRHRPGP